MGLFDYEEAARFPDQLVKGKLDSFKNLLKGHMATASDTVRAGISKGPQMLRVFLAAVGIVSAASLARGQELTLAELPELIVKVFNVHGLGCAQLLDIRPAQIADRYEVTCIEKPGGSETVHYVLDAWAQKAFRAN